MREMWAVVGEESWAWFTSEPLKKYSDLKYAKMQALANRDAWAVVVDGRRLEVTGKEVLQFESDDYGTRIKSLPPKGEQPEEQPTPCGVGWEDFDWSI